MQKVDSHPRSMNKIFLSCAAFFLLGASGAPALDYKDVVPGRPLGIPSALYYSPDYRLQWWYFTGHLFDDSGREFGYELVFFVVGVQKRVYESKFGVNELHISHFAISDIAAKKYLSSEEADSGAYGFSGATPEALKVWVESNSLSGSMKGMHIKASGRDIGLDLALTTRKPVVLNGEGGYSRKSASSPLIASYYFSFSDIETEGSLSIGGSTFRVAGKSWFDRELSSRFERGKGWDWFSIQLEDGREVMLYVIREADGSTGGYSSGTVVYKDGRYRHLAAGDFRIEVLDHYKSEKSGAHYPSLWQVLIPSESLGLRISPLLKDQEFLARSSTGNYYWEGACAVRGTKNGRAYVELTGY